MGQKAVAKFVSRVVAGCVIGVLLGSYLDKTFNTKPWIMLGLLLYVLIGSLILLVKEGDESNGKK